MARDDNTVEARTTHFVESIASNSYQPISSVDFRDSRQIGSSGGRKKAVGSVLG
ncbi:MAG: hypothetical protein FWD57_02685 [Polyangiaceae bacterium]|nr:hypothetical protein [Polyangiaceae bacterium]